MARSVAWLFVAMGLAGCAGRPVPVAVAPVVVAVPPPPAATPINAGLSAAATLWHLRAGLNVAALACRGPAAAATVARYNALLAARATDFAAAAGQQAEYEAAGGDWRDRYDDDQTRLYNFFGQPRGRDALCSAADDALTALDAADAVTLDAVAQAQLATLDRAFAPPRLDVDARVFGVPVAVMVATR